MTRDRVMSGPRLRRAVQLAFLVLFFALVVVARPRPGVDPSPLVKTFFLFDPLILVATWLAAHAVPAALLLSLVVIAVTMVLGRVFCGWVCPLGTIHALASRLFHGRRRRGNPRCGYLRLPDSDRPRTSRPRRDRRPTHPPDQAPTEERRTPEAV